MVLAFYSRDILGQLLPGFVEACADPLVRRALGSCGHWYCEANQGHGALDGAIVMAMVGLELLSWLHLVVRGGVPPGDFKPPAHDHIRKYLLAKQVPLEARALPALAAFIGTQEGCEDALEAVARIRNRTVHPPKEPQFTEYPVDLLEQAWRYVVYLLERAILAEVGFRGFITERLAWTDIEV